MSRGIATARIYLYGSTILYHLLVRSSNERIV